MIITRIHMNVNSFHINFLNIFIARFVVFGVAVVGGQGGGVEMFGLRGVSVGVVAVFCGGRKCKKKTYRRTFARLQVLFILFFFVMLSRTERSRNIQAQCAAFKP